MFLKKDDFLYYIKEIIKEFFWSGSKIYGIFSFIVFLIGLFLFAAPSIFSFDFLLGIKWIIRLFGVIIILILLFRASYSVYREKKINGKKNYLNYYFDKEWERVDLSPLFKKIEEKKTEIESKKSKDKIGKGIIGFVNKDKKILKEYLTFLDVYSKELKGIQNKILKVNIIANNNARFDNMDVNFNLTLRNGLKFLDQIDLKKACIDSGIPSSKIEKFSRELDISKFQKEFKIDINNVDFFRKDSIIIKKGKIESNKSCHLFENGIYLKVDKYDIYDGSAMIFIDVDSVEAERKLHKHLKIFLNGND